MSSPDAALGVVSLANSSDEVNAVATAFVGWRLGLLGTTVLLSVVLTLQWRSQAHFSIHRSRANEAVHYGKGLLAHGYLVKQRTTFSTNLAEQHSVSEGGPTVFVLKILRAKTHIQSHFRTYGQRGA
jgi:hypothetical protein